MFNKIILPVILNLQWKFVFMDDIWKKLYYTSINTIENKKFKRNRKWDLPYWWFDWYLLEPDVSRLFLHLTFYFCQSSIATERFATYISVSYPYVLKKRAAAWCILKFSRLCQLSVAGRCKITLFLEVSFFFSPLQVTIISTLFWQFWCDCVLHSKQLILCWWASWMYHFFFHFTESFGWEHKATLPAATLSQSRETGGQQLQLEKNALCGYEIQLTDRR